MLAIGTKLQVSKLITNTGAKLCCRSVKRKIGIDDLGRVRPPEFFQTGCYRTAARTKV